MISGIPIAFLVALTVGAFGRAGEVEEVARGISEAVGRARTAGRPHGAGAGRPQRAGVLGERVRRTAGSSTATDRRTTVPDDGGWWPVGSPRRSARCATTRRSSPTPVSSRRWPPRWSWRSTTVASSSTSVRRFSGSTRRPREIRTSRRRIVVAADAERRRIARDLHDGAQQRIVLAGSRCSGSGGGRRILSSCGRMATRVSEQIRSLLDELRALVQGIMPTTLQELGLEAGVAALADQMPMPVRVGSTNRWTGWTPRSSRPATSSWRKH